MESMIDNERLNLNKQIKQEGNLRNTINENATFKPFKKITKTSINKTFERLAAQ